MNKRDRGFLKNSIFEVWMLSHYVNRKSYEKGIRIRFLADVSQSIGVGAIV